MAKAKGNSFLISFELPPALAGGKKSKLKSALAEVLLHCWLQPLAIQDLLLVCQSFLTFTQQIHPLSVKFVIKYPFCEFYPRSGKTLL
jgi:hypothetical protein